MGVRPMAQVSVRYIVDDVEAAIKFYTEMLGFKLDMHPAPPFAMLSKGDLRLLLNKPGGAGGAGQPVSGQMPQPGGWNRFQLEFEDLNSTYEKLKASGASLRSEIIKGNGGLQ